MLSTHVRVPQGTDPKPAAIGEILHAAHIKRVHLVRPLTVELTSMTDNYRLLANILGLTPDEGYDCYRADSETVPCPHT